MNYFYNHPRMYTDQTSYFYLPPELGNNWINQNVDILLDNGQCFGNVRFINVEQVAPGEFVWVFDDYSHGTTPTQRRISHKNAIQINSAGSICAPQQQMPMPGGQQMPMPGGQQMPMPGGQQIPMPGGQQIPQWVKCLINPNAPGC